MPTTEFYINEFPQESPDSGWIGSGVGGGSGGGGGGGGGGSGGGAWLPGGGSGGGGGGSGDDKPEDWFTVGIWGMTGSFLPLVDGSDVLLMHNGLVLESVSGCVRVELECQVDGDSSGEHVRCIILELVYQYGDTTKSFIGGLLADGDIIVKAKWQSGHYNYASISKVRFRLKNDPNSVSPWVKLPFDVVIGKNVMLLTIRDGIVSIKSFY